LERGTYFAKCALVDEPLNLGLSIHLRLLPTSFSVLAVLQPYEHRPHFSSRFHPHIELPSWTFARISLILNLFAPAEGLFSNLVH
jgi:hypothetical protein